MISFWESMATLIGRKEADESRPNIQCVIPPNPAMTIFIDENITTDWDDMRDDITIPNVNNKKESSDWTKHGVDQDADLTIIRYLFDLVFTHQQLKFNISPTQQKMREQWNKDHPDTPINTFKTTNFNEYRRDLVIDIRINHNLEKLCVLIEIPREHRQNHTELLDTISTGTGRKIEDDETDFFFVYKISEEKFGGRAKTRRRRYRRSYRGRRRTCTRRRRPRKTKKQTQSPRRRRTRRGHQ